MSRHTEDMSKEWTFAPMRDNMPRSTSPTVSCLSEEKVRISPLCCNILYPKQFLGLIGWIQLLLGLFFLYTVSDIDVLKKTSIPGFGISPFLNESHKRSEREEYRDRVIRESMELQSKRIILFAVAWVFIIAAFMNFMSFNWPRQNRISNYNVARVIPIFLLSPTITNMMLCLYALTAFCLKTSTKFLFGDCKSLATLSCTDTEFTIAYLAYVLVFSFILVAVYLYLFFVLFCAFQYLWYRTYRSPPIHKAVRVSTSWSHAATKSRSYNNSVENDTASSEANEYACPPSSFATVKQVYNLQEINEMNRNNEYALPMQTFKSNNNSVMDDTLYSIYGGAYYKNSYPLSQRSDSFTSPWDRYRTLELPSLNSNEAATSAMI